jgi:hypothetical protein
VLTVQYDVLAGNAPYAAIWRRTLAAPPAQRNVLWQCFTIPECCSPFAAGRARALSPARPVSATPVLQWTSASCTATRAVRAVGVPGRAVARYSGS